MVKTSRTYYSTAEVAAEARVSRDTLLRWLKDQKVPEPDRDRNGWRVFTQAEKDRVVRYAMKLVPGPARSQRQLFATSKR